jgi:hypothetical protein|tara:strand:- start:1437 stop:1760 length:324 start_codon:yes stop_codon:yes gene_type:complete
MRKIERQMQSAICNLSNGKTWRNSNTEVAKNSEGDTSVFLHGNRIAFIGADGDITLSSCGWETPTTKSRLNAILDTFLHGASIFQKDFQWYFEDLQTPFFDGFKVSR